MSLVPLLFSDFWENLERPHRLWDQDFGLGLHNNDLMMPYMYPDQHFARNLLHHYLDNNRSSRSSSYMRPWLSSRDQRGTSVVQADKDQFHVSLDVQQFKPEEINVKVVDKFIVVEGKHEEKQDEHGYISRQFTRKYLIPQQCNIDEVKSSLSSDGVLSITVPRKEEEKSTGEITIKIEHTGKPAIAAKENPKVEQKKEEKAEKEKK